MKEPKFPLFVSLTGKKALIFGSGPVALRRGAALAEFGARVRFVSPGPEVREYPWEHRCYRPGEITDAFLVLACTDDPDVNRAICAEARAKGIWANNASEHSDCDFFFPALIRTEEFTIGITGTGDHHGRVRELARTVREVVK